MPFLTNELDKPRCLTCHYCTQCNRKVVVCGRSLFIEYDRTTCGCGLFNDFPGPVDRKPFTGHFCRYKRWLELP